MPLLFIIKRSKYSYLFGAIVKNKRPKPLVSFFDILGADYFQPSVRCLQRAFPILARGCCSEQAPSLNASIGIP